MIILSNFNILIELPPYKEIVEPKVDLLPSTKDYSGSYFEVIIPQ